MNACKSGYRQKFTRGLARYLTRSGIPGAGIWLRNYYRLLGPLPAGPCITDTELGARLIIDPRRNKGLDASLFYNGVYEAGTLHVMRQLLRSGDTFVDVGANIGLMSVVGARLVGPHGRVHAFEPVPAIHDVLEQNILLNRADNVTTHCMALGETRELREIHEQSRINRGSASLILSDASDAAAYLVRVDTIDNLFATGGNGRVRLVKIDVEGWELDVLQGARALLSGPHAPAICLEYSPARAVGAEKALAAYRFVKSVNQYGVFRLQRGKEVISPLRRVDSAADLPAHDNIFCLLPHHLGEMEQAATQTKTAYQ
jgi:FkbM family methyltransferase